MPKRKNVYAPEGVDCPGCEEMFDAEARAPIVGCCGHSLCSTCFDEKKTTTCPVCNKRGGFAKKQKSLLAIELLSALSKAHEKLFPVVLKPEFFSFLPQVVNQLDPISFVKFALTCRPIYELCFNSKEVKVPFEFRIFEFRRVEQDPLMFSVSPTLPMSRLISFFYVPVNYSGTEQGFMGSVENRKKLKNYPFVFTVKEIHLTGNNLDALAFEEMRSFLADFSIKRIPNIHYVQWPAYLLDWTVFMQFVTDFCTEEVNLVMHAPAMADNPPGFEEAVTFLLQNIVSFRSDVCIPDQLILNASVERLHLRNASISQETFVKLVKRLAHSTEEIRWLIGREPFEFGHQGIFKVGGVYKYDDDDDDCHYEPEELPLVTIDYWNSEDFFIVRKDGSRVKCYEERGKIVFSTKKFDYRSEDYTYWFSNDEDDDAD